MGAGVCISDYFHACSVMKSGNGHQDQNVPNYDLSPSVVSPR